MKTTKTAAHFEAIAAWMTDYQSDLRYDLERVEAGQTLAQVVTRTGTHTMALNPEAYTREFRPYYFGKATGPQIIRSEAQCFTTYHWADARFFIVDKASTTEMDRHQWNHRIKTAEKAILKHLGEKV